MDQQWAQLTPEAKKEQRFQWWLNPQDIKFVSPEAEKGYKQRVQRMIDVYNVQEPDMVPVSLFLSNMPAHQYGVNLHTLMYDYDTTVQIWDKFNSEHQSGLDHFAFPGFNFPGRAFDMLDFKQWAWPGHGIPQNSECLQYVEGEYYESG
jgi:hypothetical protein